MTKKHIVLIEQGTEDSKKKRMMQTGTDGNVALGISVQSGTAEPATGFVGTPQAGDIYIRYSSA